MKKSLIRNICLSLACLLGIGAMSGITLMINSKKDVVQVAAYSTTATYTFSDFYNGVGSGSQWYYTDSRGTIDVFNMRQNSGKLIYNGEGIGGAYFSYRNKQGLDITAVRITFTSDSAISPTYKIDKTGYSKTSIPVISGYNYGLTIKTALAQNEKVYFYLTETVNVNFTDLKLELLTGAATSAVTISNGTGVSSVYLSSSNSATSGSSSGSQFDDGSTVYGFAVLKKGYSAPSAWTLVSGTANTEGAKYRVGSVTAGSSNFGTINANTISYSISYDLDGGTVSTANPTSYNVNTNTITLNNPTKNGYNFIGWTGSNGTTPQTTVTIAEGSIGNKTYIANYELVTYTITYFLNGGAVATDNPTEYTILTDSFTLNNPTRYGYDFKGWYGDDIAGYDSNHTVTKGTFGNKVFYAGWDLWVSLQEVVDLINAIGGLDNVTYPDSKTAIIAAEQAFSALSAEDKAVIQDPYGDLLVNERIKYDGLRSDSIAYAVTKIGEIGEVGSVTYPASRSALLTAESAVNLLDEADKNSTVVSNYQNVLDARSEYDEQKIVKIAEVIAAIDDIGTVSYPESKNAIEHSESLYAALADEEKNIETITNYEVLTQARNDYNTDRNDKIQDVIDAINAISKPFDISRESQITNAQGLFDLLDESDKTSATITNLEYLNNAKAADVVADLIESLPSYTDVDAFVSAVHNAKDSYDDLTSTQQSYINSDLLTELNNYVSACAVVELVDDIGTVTYDGGVSDSLAKIELAEGAYDALTPVQKAIVDTVNHDVLTHDIEVYDNVDSVAGYINLIPAASESSEYYNAVDTAEEAYNSLTPEEKSVIDAATDKDYDKTLKDNVEAREVIGLIQDIGDVTFNGGTNDSLSDIKKAEEAYADLLNNNPDAKELVDSVNHAALLEARETYDDANNVASLISAIPTPSDSKEYYDAVQAAKEAYDALATSNPDAYALVNNATDVDYEKVLEDNVEAKVVIELIQDIGNLTYNGGTNDSLEDIVAVETAYNNLTDDQKALVNQANHDELVEARESYDDVDEAVGLINSIGEVKHGGEYDSEEAIETARVAYDALSDEEKALVNGYNDTYQTLDDAEHVYEAMEAIDAIGGVSYDTRSEEAINEAREIYDSLTDEQKEQLGEGYVNILTHAEEEYAGLKKNANILVIILLIIACLTLIGGIFFLIFLIKRKKDEDDDDENKNSGSSKKEPVKAMSIGGFIPFIILTSHYVDAPFVALYIISGLAVLVWLTVLVVAIMKKKQIGPFKKKAPVIEAKQEESSNGDEEEVVTVSDEKGNVFQIRFIKSFTAKLIQSPDETKKYYEELKNYVLSYKNTNSRVSWNYDSINSGRNQVLKFAIRGKTLCVYLPLNADEYAESKYKVEKVESKKFEDVPCLYRIKNDRRLGYAKELIEVVANKLGLEKGEEQHEVYANLPYEENKPLIARGLIKELKVQVNKPTEPVVLESHTNADGDEIVTTKDSSGNIFEIRYIKSFTAKLSQSSDEVKDYYNELKNYALSYKKANSRVSWYFDSINVGREQAMKFAIRGKTLCVYYALNEVDDKYKVERTESKKYSEVPTLYRVKNDRRFNYAKELIDILMKKLGLEKGKELNDEYRIPYEETKVLLAKGLIKEVKTKVEEKPEVIHSIDVEHADQMMSDEKAESSIEEDTIHHHRKGNKEIINIDTLSLNYNDGDEVTLDSLIEKKLVSPKTGYVKVLARGTLDKRLIVDLDDFSLQAVKMIVLLGGHAKKIK